MLYLLSYSPEPLLGIEPSLVPYEGTVPPWVGAKYSTKDSNLAPVLCKRTALPHELVEHRAQGRIRTADERLCRPLPYHLATRA